MWYPWEVIPVTIEAFAVLGILQCVYTRNALDRKRWLCSALIYIAAIESLMLMHVDIEIVAWSKIAIIFILSPLVRRGSFSSKCFSASLTVLILLSVQYSIRYGCSLIFNTRWSGKTAHFVLLSLNERGTIIYYAIADVCYCLAFWFLHQKGTASTVFQEKEDRILTGICIGAELLTTRLFFGLYRLTTPQLLEFCMIISVLITLLFAFGFVLFFASMIKQRNEKYQREKISLENNALTKSYEQVVLTNKQLLKQRHDFTKHLHVIRNMDAQDIQKYVSDLLNIKTDPLLRSYSGDPYVDAVLNSKVDEMSERGIDFKYSVDLPKPLSIPPSDICVILYNLLENAIEACERIDDPGKRSIDLSISQKGQCIIMICQNAILPDSVSYKDLYHSLKNDDTHGYGLLNIKNSAERNGGSLLFEINENMFVSKVMMMTE